MLSLSNSHTWFASGLVLSSFRAWQQGVQRGQRESKGPTENQKGPTGSQRGVSEPAAMLWNFTGECLNGFSRTGWGEKVHGILQVLCVGWEEAAGTFPVECPSLFDTIVRETWNFRMASEMEMPGSLRETICSLLTRPCRTKCLSFCLFELSQGPESSWKPNSLQA